MRILVAGGAGYIGSHAVRHLQSLGHDIWVFDNLCQGHAAATPPSRLIRGDLLDTPLLRETLRERRIEAVMHFAAFAQVGESVADPAKYYQNNVVAALSLLEAMRLEGMTRLVFSSTTAVYGAPETIPITEEELRQPINPYGFTKLVFEQALQDYSRAYGLGFAALRYFNAAGAAEDGTLGEDHSPETHLIPIVLQVALGQRPEIVIYGDDYPTPDGTCIRDYIHVDDLASAHALALGKIEPGQGLYLNLGTGKGHSVQEVITACREVTGHPIPARRGERRPGDPPILVADSRLAHRVLSWTPKHVDIRSIVETAWRWIREHPQGYVD